MRVKKCLSILLTLVMVLSLMPATAFAADTYTVIINSDGGSAVESQTLFPGYVLAAVIALALGVCVTLLCARKKKNNTQSDKEETP